MFDIEARVLIGWLARLFARHPIRKPACIYTMQENITSKFNYRKLSKHNNRSYHQNMKQ